MACSQEEFAAVIEREMGLSGPALERWRKIIVATEIEKRHGVMRPEEVLPLSTAARMQMYEQSAPRLAHQAATEALSRALLKAEDVTDLVVVSCTGFSAPGVDAALVELLGLRPTVRRTVVGFMGCFGAIPGLRTAVGACLAGAHSGERTVTLLVCVELCSLHLRPNSDVQNLVASALFADGAAAAIIISQGAETDADDDTADTPAHGIGYITTGASLLLPEGRDWMTWRITNSGFAMTLAREVPVALRQRLAQFVNGARLSPTQSYVVHPGGPGILDAANDALGLRDEFGLKHSRHVLRQFGNMSSATVLFVLKEALQSHAALPATLMSFGPGLSIEALQLLPMR